MSPTFENAWVIYTAVLWHFRIVHDKADRLLCSKFSSTSRTLCLAPKRRKKGPILLAQVNPRPASIPFGISPIQPASDDMASEFNLDWFSPTHLVRKIKISPGSTEWGIYTNEFNAEWHKIGDDIVYHSPYKIAAISESNAIFVEDYFTETSPLADVAAGMPRGPCWSPHWKKPLYCWIRTN